MSLSLFASLLLVFNSWPAWAEVGPQAIAPATAKPAAQPAEKKQVAGSSNAELNAKVEKMFPEKEWKTFGFSGIHKNPLVTIRVPKFLNWEQPCESHMVKDGVDYCGPEDESPILTGTLKIEGKERILRVGIEAYAGPKKRSVLSEIPIYEAVYGSFGALMDKGTTILDGKKAEFAEVDDVQARLDRPTKVLTRIDFRYPYLGGKIYFTETEKNGDTVTFVSHKDRIFQGIIDKIVASFKFKVDVNKPGPF